MNIHQVTTQLKNGEIRLTIKSLLEKLVKFFFKPRRPKTTKTQKTITIKPNKNLSTNKISKNLSSDAELISKLKPGYILDACTLMDYESFPTTGHVFNALLDKPIYVTSQVRDEFDDKKHKCPKSGRIVPRNFNIALAGLRNSSAHKIIYVEISPEIRVLAKELLSKWEGFGLHKPDNIHVAFAKFTKSTMITSDKVMIRCLKMTQCDYIEFHELAEKTMQPSPITVELRERRNHFKHNTGWKKR